MNKDTNKKPLEFSECEEKKVKVASKKHKPDEISKLCKMLSTAALSVALISWYSTANGLHQYVFDQLWQAYIVSAALQGALFALSIKGVSLLLGLNKKRKKAFFIFVWVCLLCASSIFSYVYISSIVYPTRLLQEDAHRIFATYCLEENYKLSSESDYLLNGSDDKDGIIKKMNGYVQTLAELDKGIDMDEGGNKTKIDNLRQAILPYAYTYARKRGDTKKSIDGCADSSKLVSYVDVVKDGKYTKQDIADVRAESKKLKKDIIIKKKEKTNEKNAKIKERNDYQTRLMTYTNTNSATYKDIQKKLAHAIQEISNIHKQISNLNTELGNVSRVTNVLNSVQKSMTVSLYKNVVSIRNEMNKEKIDIKKIRDISENIYKELLNNSSTMQVSDHRLADYSGFKSNLAKYESVINAQKTINSEIKAMYELKSMNDLQNDSATNVKSKKTQNDSDKNEKSKKADEKSKKGDDDIQKDGNSSKSDAWRVYWQNHLNKLKESVKKLHGAGLNENRVADLISEIEERERLYLSDLNDFERSWNLLFGNHRYKTLLKFSMGFAFGIDLFAVFISVLLYFFKRERNLKSNEKKSA